MTNKGMKMKLFSDFIKKFDWLEEASKELVSNLGEHYKNNVTFLYSIMHCIDNQYGIAEDKNIGTKYMVIGEKSRLEWNNQFLEVTHPQMKMLVAGIIDIFEEVLPIGTVVDLKKEIFHEMLSDAKSLDHLRYIVIYRFLFMDGDKIYFPYAGIPYPVGLTNPPSMIHFTSKCIERIVHMGYSDEKEEEFINFVKEELLVKQSMRSVTFADADEVLQLKERFKEKQEDSIVLNDVKFV